MEDVKKSQNQVEPIQKKKVQETKKIKIEQKEIEEEEKEIEEEEEEDDDDDDDEGKRKEVKKKQVKKNNIKKDVKGRKENVSTHLDKENLPSNKFETKKTVSQQKNRRFGVIKN